MDIGQAGVWTRMDGFSVAEAIEFAQRVEELGYGALWIPDAFGRDPFAHAALLFQHTKKLVIATGVVNIHLREAQATACAQRELHDQSGGRFLLGSPGATSLDTDRDQCAAACKLSTALSNGLRESSGSAL